MSRILITRPRLGGDWSAVALARTARDRRLPGNIVIKHENFIFYFPITTGLLISAVLTLIFWLADR